MELIGNCTVSHLHIENIKRIKLLDIVMDDHGVIVIAGRNAQGKSTALDSLSMIVGGNKLCPDEPIKRGERKGHAEAFVEDETGTVIFIARREFWMTPKGLKSKLIIKNPKGLELKKPQAIMDALTGLISFDPLQFKALDPKKQLSALRDIVGLDFDDLDAQRAEHYEERTDINRQIKDKEGFVGLLPSYPDDTPDEEVSVEALMAELTMAQEHNQNKANLNTHVVELADSMDRISASIKEKQAHLVEVQDYINNLNSELFDFESQHKQAVAEYTVCQFINEPPIRERISDSQTINANVRNKQAEKAGLIELDELQKASEHFTDELAKIEAEKERQLSIAPFPIKGLAFTPDGITYNNILFNQCSQAEQLRISVAMGMALNPKLRVMTIRDGSLLDPDNMMLIHDMATEKKFKVLMEVVGNPDDAAVVIEDGMVLDNGSEV